MLSPEERVYVILRILGRRGFGFGLDGLLDLRFDLITSRLPLGRSLDEFRRIRDVIRDALDHWLPNIGSS